MLDEEMKVRLREVGRRFRMADAERVESLDALKDLLSEVDGSCTDKEAADLVELPVTTVGFFKAVPGP